MNDLHWSRFSRTALSVAVAIVAAAPALAQNTTAAVGGRVLSPEGKPVAGATVVIRHEESGSVNTLITDAEGRYSVRGLRVGGPYSVVVTKGADKTSRGDVYLQLAESANIDLSLGAASNTLERVELVGSSAASKYDSGATGTGTTLSRKEIEAYASVARNLQDYARIDPRLSQTDKERGEVSALGQNSRFNAITVDGVRINDPFGLEANNMPTAKQPISIDAIESVQVNISNYDVTQQGYTGANINAVTKSGTNEFKGSVYFVARNDRLVGDKYNRTDNTYFKQLPFTEKTTGFVLGGPIIKGKLFFFGGYEELKSSRSAPSFGPVGSTQTNVAVSQSLLDKIAEQAKAKYGYDIGRPDAQASDLVVKDKLLKLDWNINDKHRANVRYTRTDQAEPNFGTFNSRAMELSSSWWSQKKSIETVVGQWFADWTPNFSTELKVSNRSYNSVPDAVSFFPSVTLSVSGPAPAGAPAGVDTSNSRSVFFGADNSRTFNILKTKTLDAYFGANLVADDHELKFGADLSRNKIYNGFFQNTYGNYTFKCDTVLDPSAVCSTAAGVDAAILKNFTAGRPSSFQVQQPLPGSSLDAGAANWTLRNEGFFLQDTWTVNDRLTLIAGVRLDALGTNDHPTYNPAASAPMVAADPSKGKPQSGGFGMDNSATINGNELWQPRFGFNYQISKAAQQKSQIRGGFGLFQGAAANVWLTNPYSNTGMATRILGCGLSGFANCPNTGAGIFNPDPASQVGPSGTSKANVDFIQPGLGQPSVWKANLAYDRELPWMGMVFAAEWVYTRTSTGIYYQNLNLGAPTRTGLDGRELYYGAKGFDPTCWRDDGNFKCGSAPSKALGNSAFGNVLMAAKTKQGGGNSVTLSISQPTQKGFGWSVAYTRSSATEVSPLTSSVANSNFNSRAVFNPNEDVAANSAYLIRDRISASLNWSKAFVGSYKTTVGLFYEGRRGKPYSWTYGNDMNGDGVIGNDLMYIPKGPQSGEVVFVGDTATNHANEDRFWSFVNSVSALRNAKGGVVARNSTFANFVNTFDLRVSQQVPGLLPNHKGSITLDILNVGNFLNKKWGHIDEVAFQSGGGMSRNFVNYGGIDANGHYIYSVSNNISDMTTRQAKGESQWAAQVTLRYEF